MKVKESPFLVDLFHHQPVLAQQRPYHHLQRNIELTPSAGYSHPDPIFNCNTLQLHSNSFYRSLWHKLNLLSHY